MDDSQAYILSCHHCGKMIGDVDYQLDFCFNCNKDVSPNKGSNYKKCDNCKKIFLADCNTYYCSCCGSLLDLMNPSIIYCHCGYGNNSLDSYCLQCMNPLNKELFLEIYHKDHKHEIVGLDPSKYCEICGIRRLPKSPKKSLIKHLPKCIVCMEETVSHAFIPCGHLVVCNKCQLLDFKEHCPICRTKFTNICKIWF